MLLYANWTQMNRKKLAQNLFSCSSCPFLLYTLIDTNENHFSYAGGRRADISMMHEKLIIFRKHLIKKLFYVILLLSTDYFSM